MTSPNRSRTFIARLSLLSGFALLSACNASLPPLETVDHVDLDRFMGDWYVIASIPTFVERGAHDAVESYRLEEDGTIATTFTFHQNAFDGPEKIYHPRGFVRNKKTNAEWGMQFIWPIKADFRITWLDEDYSKTVIGRNKRDHVWIMARTPQIPAADYQRMVEHIGSNGYDVSLLVRVPHQATEGRR